MAVKLYNDSNYQELLPDSQGVFEFEGPRVMNFVPPKAGVGEVKGTIPFPDKLIPRSDWPALIQKKDAEKSWLEDMVRGVVKCSDQNGLGYCHGYGTKGAGECCRLIMGLPYIELSGESIAGPVTNWRNAGADPADDLEQLSTYGACPQSFMDAPHSRSPKKWKAGWEQYALNFRATEIWDIRGGSKSFDFVATCALLGLACASGFQWWSHFISGPYRLIDLGRGKFALRYRNNWGSKWGDDGFVDFQEGKGDPDWAFAIRQMVPFDA